MIQPFASLGALLPVSGNRVKIICWLTLVVLMLTWGGVAAAAGGDALVLAEGDRSQAVTLLIVFVSLALGVSFLCSVAEAVLLSITPTYIEGLREKKPKRADLLTRLRFEQVDRSLAAILTMNTIAHTVGAIEAGAQSAVVFGSTWVGIFSAVMTLLILFISEIIPKTLGAVYWPQLVNATALYIRTLIVTLYPLVKISEALTQLIARGREVHHFSRDEFMAMVGLGEQTGILDPQEHAIIRNLIQLRFLRARDIMTPRTVIAALALHMDLGEAKEVARSSPFSRLPVFGTGIDDIRGFVLKDELLACQDSDGAEGGLSGVMREVIAVPESMELPRLMNFFIEKRVHLAVVVDEFGGTRGLVTLEDVVETLLGMEIVDELDSVADMQALARKQWERRAKRLGLEHSVEGNG